MTLVCLQVVVPVAKPGQIGQPGLAALADGLDMVDLEPVAEVAPGYHADLVTFDAVEGKPVEPPMVFQPAHDGLQAVTWNHASWGKVDPPPMKKGFKVKQLYWLTTGP